MDPLKSEKCLKLSTLFQPIKPFEGLWVMLWTSTQKLLPSEFNTWMLKSVLTPRHGMSGSGVKYLNNRCFYGTCILLILHESMKILMSI
jgi:hypothetical protein